MENDQILQSFKKELKALEEGFAMAANKLRTGRAHPAILDDVTVEVYETRLPIVQVASITNREANVLVVTPFDATNITAVSKAIAADDKLNLHPTDDGRAVYVQVPPLTTERRREIVKSLHGLREDFLIRLRQARHHSLKVIRDNTSAEEAVKHLEKDIEKATTAAKSAIESSSLQREQEILGDAS